ncbi:MAG TPA: glycoside hydrolase family 36 N-terminal domain-containing protein, partial [Clostridiales bacterium]|nr:glycoside hydrolase family 36 N-terminal domain-containing protein [Clostridiales bacterium]
MGIKYFEDQRVFKLDANNTSYIIGIVDDEDFIGHVYFGRRIGDGHFSPESLMHTNEYPFLPSKNNRDRLSFYDAFPREYPTHGIGDFRETCLEIRDVDGHAASKLQYVSHRITGGKPKLDGLPATFGNEDDCTTLEIFCEDTVLKL